MRTWNLGRVGLKQLDRIFTVFPLKVTVAIVLEKLSGTSAGSCKAHKSHDSLSPRIGGSVEEERFREKAGAQPVGTLSSHAILARKG